jgi:hypothetical protein
MKLNPYALTQIVSISFYGRSGSYLLQGLLDNHPQIISVPPHSLKRIIEFMGSPEFAETDDVRQLVEMFAANYPFLFQETDHGEDWPAIAETETIGVPHVRFKDILAQILTELHPKHQEPSLFFRAVHSAYHFALGKDLSQVKVIAWQKHSPFASDEDRQYAIDKIKNIKFLVPVRRPEVALSSMFESRNMVPGFKATIREVDINIDQITIGGVVHEAFDPIGAAVRFEDMHSNTEKVMRAVAKWIGVDWNQTMLEPTIDGKEMLFYKKGKILRGLNRNIEKEQCAQHFTWFGKLAFQWANRQAYDKWGYRRSIHSKSLNSIIEIFSKFIPMKMEWILFKQDIVKVLKTARNRRRATKASFAQIRYLHAEDSKHKFLDLIE